MQHPPQKKQVHAAQSHYERHFLQSLMARWPRRGRSLVQFGCNDANMLEYFWESGFDVTGVETEHRVLEVAKERMGQRADWHLGPYDHTPFEDKEFDYVVVFHILEMSRQAKQEAIMKEAVRLSTRGVLIVVDNSWSLAHWNAGGNVHEKARENMHAAMNIFQLWRVLRRVQAAHSGRGLITWGTALHGPRWTWSNTWTWPWHWSFLSGRQGVKAKPIFDLINQGYTYSPFGASLFLCLDLGRGRAITPLLLRTHERAHMPTVQAYPPTVLGHEKGRHIAVFTEEENKNRPE